MRIAILYICTGQYSQFFQPFYESAETFFMKGQAEKHYFVFTDDRQLSQAANVTLIYRECQGFPLDSLFRFDMFLSIEEQLKAYDYCFFFNSNMKFLKPVGQEFLPEKEGLMAVLHSGYYRKPYWAYPYERSPKANAYIPPHDKPYHYFQGCLNGGKTELFLEFARTCSEETHEDYNKGIIALVHDESYLNKYMHYHPCVPMSPSYAYPEGKHLPVEPIILQIDKRKVSTYFHNKGYSPSYWAKFKKGIRIFKNILRWYGKY